MYIQGKNVFAMMNDETSITTMLTYMGVQPTPERVSAAAAQLGPDFTMSDLYEFLKSEGIMTGENPVVDLR
jgi:hypothetical protein